MKVNEMVFDLYLMVALKILTVLGFLVAVTFGTYFISYNLA